MSDLSATRLYLVAARRLAAGALAELVEELADAGVDLIQLREKELEGGELLAAAEPVAAACAAAGVSFLVNDRPDVALALGAGVHVGQGDVPVWLARRILGDRMIGRSTHSAQQIEAEAAAEHAPDYIAVGPVHATPTKPGRPGVGHGLVGHAARAAAQPWFAIGGISVSNLREVMDAGARRIVVVRAITEAADPPRAAAELRSLLDETPLDGA